MALPLLAAAIPEGVDTPRPPKVGDDLTIGEIKRAVLATLGPVHPSSNDFKAGVILLSLVVVGDDLEKIAAFTGYSLARNIVQPILQRVRANGIYKDGAVHCDWMDEEHGAIAYTCDVLVATGFCRRVPPEETKPGRMGDDQNPRNTDSASSASP